MIGEIISNYYNFIVPIGSTLGIILTILKINEFWKKRFNLKINVLKAEFSVINPKYLEKLPLTLEVPHTKFKIKAELTNKSYEPLEITKAEIITNIETIKKIEFEIQPNENEDCGLSPNKPAVIRFVGETNILVRDDIKEIKGKLLIYTSAKTKKVKIVIKKKTANQIKKN